MTKREFMISYVLARASVVSEDHFRNDHWVEQAGLLWREIEIQAPTEMPLPHPAMNTYGGKK